MLQPIKKIKNIVLKYSNHYNKYSVNNIDRNILQQIQIIVYMSGNTENSYQLKQWISPLKILNDEYPIAIITRNINLFKVLKKEISFPILFLHTFNELMRFYNQYKIPVILYVNNANQNFQSLAYTKGFHLHINHGESEKESMYSNQSKAYDAVFCVGDRAVQRYQEALLNFDADKYIKVGRPQLDFITPYPIEKKPHQKVILYAPTWEGHLESMDYCSVLSHGKDLIEKLLKNPNYFIIYKPHGNIGFRRKDIKNAHNEIVQRVTTHTNGLVLENEEINNIFPSIDFAFFDNSSVMIDYLHVDKPAFYFDILEDKGLRYLKECFTPIKHETADETINLMEKHLAHDPKALDRQKIKKFYLGEYAPMESTRLFVNTVGKFIKKRGAIFDS